MKDHPNFRAIIDIIRHTLISSTAALMAAPLTLIVAASRQQDGRTDMIYTCLQHNHKRRQLQLQHIYVAKTTNKLT